MSCTTFNSFPFFLFHFSRKKTIAMIPLRKRVMAMQSILISESSDRPQDMFQVILDAIRKDAKVTAAEIARFFTRMP